MMKDKNAILAIRTLHSSGLVDLIFTPPSDFAAPSLAGISPKDFQAWKESMKVQTTSDKADLASVIDRVTEMKFNAPVDDSIFHFALLMSRIDSSNIALLTRLAMKIPNEVCKNIATILNGHDELRSLINDIHVNSDNPEDSLKVRTGRFIRSQAKIFWREGALIALATSNIASSELLSRYTQFVSLVTQHELEECYSWKPIVDGTEIQKQFSLPPSKRIQELLNHEFDLMFAGVRDRDLIVAQLAQIVKTNQ